MNSELKNLLIIDIETVSVSSSFETLPENLRHHWERKALQLRNDEGKSASDLYFEKAGIYAEFGKIIVIAVGIFHEVEGEAALRVTSFQDHDEAKLLNAFRVFLDDLPKDKAEKCHFILHTEPRSEHGTDLEAVVEHLFGKDYPNNITFSTTKYPQDQLNLLYNCADAQILLTSNEGWGLTLTESLLVGNPIIANVTGGMQDQMRFEDENGEWFTPSPEIPSNHKGTYKKHGEWAFPVYPTSRSIQGSPPTPYIYDDRCSWEDACERIKEVYNLTKDERNSRGLKGREWAMSDEAGFTQTHQSQRVIEAFEELFEKWVPREKFEIINATTQKGKYLNHKITY